MSTAARMMALATLLTCSACRSGRLSGLSGALEFSSPDDPAAVQQPDGGLVVIAFGDVTVGVTKTLELDCSSLGAPVTLGSVSAITADPEFILPLVPGTIVQSSATEITASFTPTSLGQKTATFELSDQIPLAATVHFELSGRGVPNGIGVNPNPVDFGNVEVNTLQSITVTVSNSAARPASLLVSSPEGRDAERFTLGAPSGTALAPGASATLTATFAPLTIEDAEASFTVQGWSDVPPVTVGLAGAGVQSVLEVASPLDFGFVQLTDTLTKSAVIRNTSHFTTVNLILPKPSISQPVGQSVFSVGRALAIPTAIAPGKSASIPVAFAPTALQQFGGALFVTSDDLGGRYPTIQLTGYGGGPRIDCQPQATFGPMPPGFPAQQPVICINNGTDIPSHPELTLRIATSGIWTDDAAFTASLLLEDGGLAAAGDSLTLSARQSATIEVTFRPSDAGTYLSRLGVSSNDTNDQDAGTLLVGQGIALGPCTLTASPNALDFGNVPPGRVGSLSLLLTNDGQDLCFAEAAIGSGSAQGFAVLTSGAGYLLSYVGNTDNPTGLPSSVAVPVTYTPGAPTASATGTVSVTAAGPNPESQIIDLFASSETACFVVAPASYDFGGVPMSALSQTACTIEARSFVGTNQCSAPVAVRSLALDPAADASPQFRLDAGFSFFQVFNLGDQAPFSVSFVPSGFGAKSEDVLVTSSDAPNAPQRIAVKGDALATQPRTDTFTAPTPPKELDLLFVIDEDDDEQQANLVKTLLPRIVKSLDDANIDYHLAVTSTDTCDAGSSDIGAIEPCDHCISQTSGAPFILTPTTPSGTATLVDIFTLFDEPPQLGACWLINGDEHFFDAIVDAFSPANLNRHNAGFLRPEARLSILVVNADDEDDGSMFGVDTLYPTSLRQVTSLLQGLKSDPSQVSVSYLLTTKTGIPDPTQLIAQLVAATHGSELDSTQPLQAFEDGLTDAALFGKDAEAFRLSESAIPGSISVTVNGSASTAWSYEEAQNAIHFDSSVLPSPGSVIAVTYQVGCP